MTDCRPPLPQNILDTIGDTPLVRLNRFLDRRDVALYAKLEMANPGGSAKDRPARRMLQQALADGEIARGSLVVESSSGNTAIGLAQFCRYYGLRFRCVVDPRTQEQNLRILRAYGAEVELVEEPDPATGDWLAARLARVRKIVDATPGAFWPNQYANTDNPRAHELGTMREIDDALDGRIDAVFIATSTTGTARGCARYLRQRGRSTRVVAVDARGSALFGGPPGDRPIPGFGAGTVPPLAKEARFDDLVRVSALDCVVGCRRLAERESLLAGGSSGGVLQAVRLRVAEMPPESTCVVILADRGTRYLDTVFDDAWVASRLGCSPEELARLVAEPDPAWTTAATG